MNEKREKKSGIDGAKLRAIRESKRMRQAKLSSYSGVAYEVINALENNRYPSSPSVLTALKLADVLEVPVDAFLDAGAVC